VKITGQINKYNFNKIIQIIICAIAITCMHLGCIFKNGLDRTSLRKWEIRNFPTIGFKADLPKQSKLLFGGYLENLYDNKRFFDYENYKSLDIRFHPISARILADSIFLLDVFIIRVSDESFGDFRKGEHKANYYWKTDETKFEPEIIQRKEDLPFFNVTLEHVCFRRDIRAPNGDVIIGIAQLVTQYAEQTPETIEEDIQAIKRILNSIEPIE